MKTIKETTYKGTRILLGNSRRTLLNRLIDLLISEGFTEVDMPVINYYETFKNKVGEENNNLMFSLTDRGGRELCLAPEYTAIIQKLSTTTFKYEKDVKVFYVQKCFRGENPQRGRFREFTQFGVEILNPTKAYDIASLAEKLISVAGLEDYTLDKEVTRGLDYYEGLGFEIRSKSEPKLQLVGGGKYEGGTGFAIGIDRLELLLEKQSTNEEE